MEQAGIPEVFPLTWLFSLDVQGAELC